MQPVRLRLFGIPALAHGDSSEPLAPDRLGQMAIVLAARGAWTKRDQLAALLWPGLADDAARRNLRRLIYDARKRPWIGGIEVHADAVRWLVDSDLRRFEAACAERDWARAVGSYGGAFAEGAELKAPDAFVEWLRFERDRLAAQFRAVASQQLAALGSDAVARTALAQRWLALDPLDEDALAEVVDAANAQGRAAEAQREIAAFTQRLSADLGVAPSARVRALAGAAAVVAPVPIAIVDADFVGRRTELMDLLALIARDECRVLTLTGPGGIGKSRLARVANQKLAPQFDAAHWIRLQDVAEIAQVASRIATSIVCPYPKAPMS
jgi:DNA-binding SARP family transcriptional activator